MVPTSGIEPLSIAYQASALPLSYIGIYESRLLPYLNALTSTFKYGLKWGIEPSLAVSQTAVQPVH